AARGRRLTASGLHAAAGPTGGLSILLPNHILDGIHRLLPPMNIRISEYMDRVIYLSRRIYEGPGDRPVGGNLQGARRPDAPSDSRAAGEQRGLRVPYPRRPRRAAADRLPAPGILAPGRTRRGAAR